MISRAMRSKRCVAPGSGMQLRPQTRRACLGTRFFMLGQSGSARRQGFARRRAPPHQRWGPRRGAARSSSTPGAMIRFIRIPRCPRFWDAAPAPDTQSVSGNPIFYAWAEWIRPAPRFCPEGKTLARRRAPPHQRWGPRRGAASSSTPGAMIRFIKIPRCPRFWDAAPRRGCCSRR